MSADHHPVGFKGLLRDEGSTITRSDIRIQHLYLGYSSFNGLET